MTFLRHLREGKIVINNHRDIRCADVHPRYRAKILSGEIHFHAKESPALQRGWRTRSQTALVCWLLWMFDPNTANSHRDWYRTGEGSGPKSLREVYG